MISDERLEQISQCSDVVTLFAYEQRQMARELLALRKAREGWKLVPIEPSWEMISAAIKNHEGDAFLPVSLYKNMLAAAPEVE